MPDARTAPEAHPMTGAQYEPWWGEALRALRAGDSIRAVAKRFQTNPRRIRRALARAGIRTAGQAIHRGVAALAPFADRLGREPDGVIAKAAKVAIEAVAGERRRLAIRPFRPRGKSSLSPDDDEWIRGPVRRGRIKATPNESVEVVRRVVRVEPVVRPAGSPPLVRRPTPAPIAPAPLAPEDDTSMPAIFRNPRGVQTIRSGGEGAPVVLGRTAESTFDPTRPLPAHKPSLRRMRVEDYAERQREIEELLNAPRRERDPHVRKRLIRAEQPRLLEPEPIQPPTTTRKKPAQPEWRVIEAPPEPRPHRLPAAIPQAPVPVLADRAPIREPVVAPAARWAAPAPRADDVLASPRTPKPPRAGGVEPAVSTFFLPDPAVAEPPVKPPPLAAPSPAPAAIVPAEPTRARFSVWSSLSETPFEVDAYDVTQAIQAVLSYFSERNFEVIAVERMQLSP